jgi:maltose/maltodextrin transport system substrate-binding protein
VDDGQPLRWACRWRRPTSSTPKAAPSRRLAAAGHRHAGGLNARRLALADRPGERRGRRRTPLRLLVWINGDKGYNGLQKVGDAFTAKAACRWWCSTPKARPTSSQAAAAAGKGPDIICWPHDRAGEWAKSGLVVPVQARPRRCVTRSTTRPGAFTYRGQVWGYPLSIEAIGLIYNKALVQDAAGQLRGRDRARQAALGQGKKAPSSGTTTTVLLQLAAAGRPGRLRLRPHAAGRPRPQAVGVNTPGAVVRARRCWTV